MGERCAFVWKCHGFDEVLLEAVGGRRLDLLDAPHHLFDLVAARGIEQRDARAARSRCARARRPPVRVEKSKCLPRALGFVACSARDVYSVEYS